MKTMQEKYTIHMMSSLVKVMAWHLRCQAITLSNDDKASNEWFLWGCFLHEIS